MHRARLTRVMAAAALAAAALVGVSGSSTGAPAAGPAARTFDWTSTQPVLTPQRVGGRDLVSTKDPSVVRVDGRWHVFFTMYEADVGWTLAYKTFERWGQADDAEQVMLDQTDVGPGYKAAPQVFYFEPQGLWYLVFQTGAGGSYSTTSDITDPTSWSETQDFYSEMPQVVEDNIGNGYWLDFWTICDEDDCYLFSSDDNGHLYRSETDIEDFPEGFDDSTVIALEDQRERLFEAVNVYRISGTNKYLLLHEAIGGDGRRWFRSWTSRDIEGPWIPLADSERDAFARANNVRFQGRAWTRDISHGEMVRDSYDQVLSIDPCARNTFLYQGVAPEADGDYGLLPYRLGLLRQRGPDPLDRFCRR